MGKFCTFCWGALAGALVMTLIHGAVAANRTPIDAAEIAVKAHELAVLAGKMAQQEGSE